MAFTQFLNCDSLRTPQAECRPPQDVTLAVESPSQAAVTTGGYCSAANEIFDDKPSTSAVVEEKTFDNDALLVGGARPAENEVASTSYEPVDVFPPFNFGDMDVEQQANTLFHKGPLRTLSARTFEALLDDSNLRENEEWTALQNLPSLPRDLSAVDLVQEEEEEEETMLTKAMATTTPEPPSPLPAVAAAAAADDAADAADEMMLTAYADSAAELVMVDLATMELDSVHVARAKAKAARAKAEEARRFATQKTATATALTIHAKEILDVAATVKGSGSGGGKIASPPSSSRQSSGVQTPNATSEARGGWGCGAGGGGGGTLSGDVSSPSTGNKRARSGEVKSKAVKSGGSSSKGRGGKKAAAAAAAAARAPADVVHDDDTDLEDDVGPAAHRKPSKAGRKSRGPGAGVASGASAEKAVSKVAPRIQATDSIITSSGKKVRRGCLNCQAQKTPQWRMGPEGPKTLCNACGVRYRKGLPLSS